MRRRHIETGVVRLGLVFPKLLPYLPHPAEYDAKSECGQHGYQIAEPVP